jgi:NitT/TauT family transport system permease protein
MSQAPIAVQPLPRGAVSRRVGSRLRDWAPAVVVFLLVIAAWEGLVRALDVERFLLPPISDILERIREDPDTFVTAGRVTLIEALGGFGIGAATGILAALVLARWRGLGGAIMPYAIAANAVPIVAFAPITNNWFGAIEPESKMAIAAVICFFPVFVNTLRGLTSVRPAQIELLRSYAAGEVDVFRRVRIPNALPYLFTGLKVATVLAMIGAIVGDYFGGSPNSLGTKIRQSAGYFDFDTAWAAIVVASVLGIAFYAVVALVERLTMGWHPSARRTE